MRSYPMATLAFVTCAFFSAACARLDLPSADPLLGTTPLPADALVLETCVASFPWGYPFLNASLWKQIDETRIPWKTRMRCQANGIRAGVIPGHAPDEIVKLIRDSEKGQKQDGLAVEFTDAGHEQPSETFRRQLRSGQRCEIAVGELLPSETVFYQDSSSSVSGETFSQAQHVLSGRVETTAQGAVKIQVTPELQHGEASLRPVALGAGLSWQSGRDRKVFTDLQIEVDLQPGEILVLSCDPEKQASIGGRAFRAGEADSAKQKIVLIRLTQTQHDHLFDDAIEDSTDTHTIERELSVAE